MASSSRPTLGSSGKAPRSPESFDSLARRNEAAEILQSYEKLSWASAQKCQSLVQTRLHFQNIVAGFDDEDEARLIHWKTDHTPRPRPGKDPRSAWKGKERVSSGGGDGVASGSGSAQRTDRPQDRVEGAATASSSTSRKRKSGSGG